MYPRLLQFGHFAIPTYGAFAALALIAALASLVYFARRVSLDANKMWNLGLIGIITALIAARLLVVAEYFGTFRQYPFWVLGLTVIRSSWVDPAAILIGFAAAMLYVLAEGLPFLRVLDCIAPSAALALAINRMGAFLAGADAGLPARHGWGVTYSSRIAALWYQMPLGVRLYPVQLYEAAASLAVLGALCWRLPRRAQDGELWGAWLFLSGVITFFLDFFRAATQSGWILHQAIALLAVAISAAFLVRRRNGVRARSYTVVDDPQHT